MLKIKMIKLCFITQRCDCLLATVKCKYGTCHCGLSTLTHTFAVSQYLLHSFPSSSSLSYACQQAIQFVRMSHYLCVLADTAVAHCPTRQLVNLTRHSTFAAQCAARSIGRQGKEGERNWLRSGASNYRLPALQFGNSIDTNWRENVWQLGSDLTSWPVSEEEAQKEKTAISNQRQTVPSSFICSSQGDKCDKWWCRKRGNWAQIVLRDKLMRQHI